jgi:HSP20 family protein
MEKDNIEVNLADHTLTIKGEKKKEEEVKEKNYYRSERFHGSFLRTLELPKDVHGDKVKASFKNGILEVRLPKTEEAENQRDQSEGGLREGRAKGGGQLASEKGRVSCTRG